VFRLNLLQIFSAVPEIFVTDSAKNRTLRSLRCPLRAVTTASTCSFMTVHSCELRITLLIKSSYFMKSGSKATPVGDDATTLVLPQRDSPSDVTYDVSRGVHHALPDTT